MTGAAIISAAGIEPNDLSAVGRAAVTWIAAQAEKNPTLRVRTSSPTWCWKADAALSVVERPDEAAVDELVEHYRTVVGEPEDPPAFRRAQVTERRVLVRFTPTRAYGMANLPG